MMGEEMAHNTKIYTEEERCKNSRDNSVKEIKR